MIALLKCEVYDENCSQTLEMKDTYQQFHM